MTSTEISTKNIHTAELSGSDKDILQTIYKELEKITLPTTYRSKEPKKGFQAHVEEEDDDEEICDGCGDTREICENSAHPCYKCDGGCGKIMGSSDECQRICDDCQEFQEEDEGEE